MPAERQHHRVNAQLNKTETKSGDLGCGVAGFLALLLLQVGVHLVGHLLGVAHRLHHGAGAQDYVAAGKDEIGRASCRERV